MSVRYLQNLPTSIVSKRQEALPLFHPFRREAFTHLLPTICLMLSKSSKIFVVPRENVSSISVLWRCDVKAGPKEKASMVLQVLLLDQQCARL